MVERGQFQYPDWYLEALKGAGRIEEEGKPDEAERLRFQANLALAMYMGTGAKDSKGNYIMGENGSTQLKSMKKR